MRWVCPILPHPPENPQRRRSEMRLWVYEVALLVVLVGGAILFVVPVPEWVAAIVIGVSWVVIFIAFFRVARMLKGIEIKEDK